MLLIYYPSIRGEYSPDYSKNSTWNLFHAHIDAHSQILIDEYIGYGVQAISIIQYQCSNMNFSDQSRYNRPFQQVIQKGMDPKINYIKIFQNSKALEISVSNSYSEYQIMHTFLDNFHKSGKLYYQIAIHQA